MDGHCNTHTIHEAISFPRGTQPNPTQHVPGNSKKARKRVDKPKSPKADPLPQVILGLLTLGIHIGRDNSSKNPIFPKKGKSKTSNQAKGATGATGNDTGTVHKPKCTLCTGAHSNLMFCSKLTQYLPYGNNQVKPHVSLCVKCLGTVAEKAKKCDHYGNKYWKSQLCPTTNKHYLMCNGCSHHLPAMKYLKDHHKPSIGYKNFTLMKHCFGDDVFRAMRSTCNGCKACKTT